MTLRVIRNDITTLKVDAIVNAANCDACVGDGVDLAIYKAAGYDNLLKERKKIGAIASGECVPTSGFELPCKYILHTVGTFWEGGGKGEESILRSCYQKALQWARRLGCQSVAMPLLAAGNFGYPKELALRIAQEEINDFLAKHDLEVILVVYDSNSLLLSKDIFSDIKEYIDNKYIAEKKEMLGNPRTIMNKPAKSATLKEFLGKQGEKFSDMVMRIIAEKGYKPVDVYTAANMDRKSFSKIRTNPDFHPNKLTAISVAIGLKLSLADAKLLLETAGYSFSRSEKFDLIIVYCLEHGIYDRFKIEYILYDNGFEGIGHRLSKKDLL